MSSWAELSRSAILRVHNSLPEKATYAERKAALLAAYPFGVRAHFPYKAWCQEQRKYLARYKPKTAPKDLTPIEAAISQSDTGRG